MTPQGWQPNARFEHLWVVVWFDKYYGAETALEDQVTVTKGVHGWRRGGGGRPPQCASSGLAARALRRAHRPSRSVSCRRAEPWYRLSTIWRSSDAAPPVVAAPFRRYGSRL